MTVFLFSIYLEGQDIKVMLKMENESNMSGKAVYSEGEVPLTLYRQLATDSRGKSNSQFKVSRILFN